MGFSNLQEKLENVFTCLLLKVLIRYNALEQLKYRLEQKIGMRNLQVRKWQFVLKIVLTCYKEKMF